MGSCQCQKDAKSSKKEVEWKVVRDKKGTKLTEISDHVKVNEEEELRSLIYHYFDEFDSNGDNELDIQEIFRFLQKICEKYHNKSKVTLKDAKTFLEKADLNQDGKISK